MPSAEQLAIQALAAALADPMPRVLFGSAKKAGLFMGSSAPLKKAAEICLEQRWIEPTGEFQGTGQKRKETYRLTQEGIRVGIERSEPIELLRRTLAVVDALAKSQDQVLSQQQVLAKLLPRYQVAIEKVLLRSPEPAAAAPALAAPVPALPATSPSWREEALRFLEGYQDRHVQAFCSLADLYVNVVARHGATIGQFHDGLRSLVAEAEVRLHPFTGARFALEREAYALLASKEIMYYVERVLQP